MDTKEILGEELAAKVNSSTDELVKQIVVKLTTAKLMPGDATQYVPKSEFNEKNDLVKVQKEQLAKADADMKAIKAEAENIPTLKVKISEMETANKAAKAEYDASQLGLKKTNAFNALLFDNIVSDPLSRDTLTRATDIDKLELDETGKIKGGNDILKPYKENPAFKGFFGTTRMVGQQHQQGDVPEVFEGWGGKPNPFDRKTLNITQQSELTRTQPELAAKLKAAAGQ